MPDIDKMLKDDLIALAKEQEAKIAALEEGKGSDLIPIKDINKLRFGYPEGDTVFYLDEINPPGTFLLRVWQRKE